MNKDVVIGFIKKNLVSLACAVVALLAVAATFYPVAGMFETMQTDATNEAGNEQAIAAFSKTRKFPVTDPSKSAADAVDLTVFPNAALIKAGQAIDDKLIAQSKAAIDYVRTLSATGHTLLVPGALPDAQSQTTSLKFAEVYTKVLSTDPAIRGLPDPDNAGIVPDPTLVAFKAMNLQNDILHGGLPPSQAEIGAAAQTLWKSTFEPRIYTHNGTPVNQVEVTQDFNAAAAKLPQQLKAEVAKKRKIYIEKTAFELNPKISVNSAPFPTDIWYAQSALWIQQDVARAIADANSQTTSVLDAQVKHLISLHIDPEPMYTFPPAGSTGAAVGMGATGSTTAGPSAANETQPLPPVYTISATGRTSNAMYDVVHFTILLDVDARHVNDVIQSFSKGKLITIYNQNMYALDTAREAGAGFLYGNSRVVRLTLDGEFLFMRSWTTAWMPSQIKVALGLTAPTGAAGAPGMVPGMVPAAMPQPDRSDR